MAKRLFEPMFSVLPVSPALLLLVVLPVLVLFVFSSPPSFPEGHVVSIEDGWSLFDIAEHLAEEDVLRSELPFIALVTILGADEKLHAGDYLFEEPLSLFRVAWRLRLGTYGLSQVRVRVQEGFTSVQIADLFEEQFDVFDGDRFLRIVEGSEGMLFPDTYFFFVNVTADEVAKRLLETFDEKTEWLREEVASSTRSFDEILVMASIIEREAHDPVDQKLISGVLWNRIEIGMALQADATLYYLLGKPSSELTQEDLETDSPFNTYLYSGLPPAPISNPSLSALEAALYPTESDYFFYLSDSDGNTYFAEDFEGHIENRRLYLGR